MSRAYIRLDPAFFERKILEQGYSAGEALALVGSLCMAEQQIPRGRFRSERVLRALLGQYGRFVPKLIERRDLVNEGGRLYVDGWDDWQEGDVTVKERMARLRVRKTRRNDDRNSERNEPVPPRTVRSSPSNGGAELQSGAQHARDDDPDTETDLFAFLAQNGAYVRPESGFGVRLVGLVERRGIEAVMEKAKTMLNGEHLSDRQWVFGLEKALEAIPSPPMDELPTGPDPKAVRRQERVEAARLEYFRLSGRWDSDLGPEPEWQPEWGERPKVAA